MSGGGVAAGGQGPELARDGGPAGAADRRRRRPDPQPDALAEAGPWWDSAAQQILQRTPQEQAELDGLARLLGDCDDLALLQREA